MKNRNLAFKAALNSLCVILATFTVLQAVGYTRDAILLETGTVLSFLESFGAYMGTRVLPVVMVFLVIIYLQARRIERSVRRIETGAAATEEERKRAIKHYSSFKRLILGLNLLGFTIGYIVDLAIIGELGLIFELDRLSQLAFNLTGGSLYALAQIAINRIIFAPAREILRIESVEETKREMSVRNRLIMMAAIAALYSALFLYRNDSAAFQQEAIYSQTLQEAMTESLSQPEIERRYAEKLSALLSTSSSRVQLSAEEITFPSTDPDVRYRRARASSFLMFLVAIGIVVLTQSAWAMDIRRQLRMIVDRIRNVSRGDGDLSARVPVLQGDEIGEIASEFNTFMDTMNDLIRSVIDVSNAVAKSSESIQDALGSASSAAEESYAATQAVKESSSGQIVIAEEAKGSFDELFGSIKAISESVDSQATTVDETSSAMEEMAASIRSVSDAAENARATARELSDVAESGGKSIHDSIESIQTIREASKRVSNIVGIISDLTEQTNLLAMNAAIEAAHAGQEGRGFAVVASEVKRLAEDESGRTSEVFTQIEDMIERVERGVELSDNAVNSFGRISEDIQKTVSHIEEITSAMQEQASGTTQVVGAVTSLVHTTHTIRERAASQSESGEKIRDHMSSLVEVASTIGGAANEQVSGNREVLEAIRRVAEEADRNASAVESLRQEMARFRLHDGS